MSDKKNLTVKEAFDLAIQNHQKNNLQDAQNYYQKVLKIEPNNSPTLNNLGAIFKALGDIQKAKECYEQVIKINPTYAAAHNNLGVIFKDLGEDKKAKECYEQAIKINPTYADAHYNLGVIFKELGEDKKAKECFEKAIEINPTYVNAHYNLGNIFKELGEDKKAKECFEKAIEINPTYADAHYNLGVIFKALGDIQKAKECYEQVIKINPTYAAAHNNLGVIFKDLGEDKKAKECYEQVIKINPTYAAAHNNLGVIFKDLGEDKKAKECYEQAIKINPTYADAHYNLGVIFKELGKYQQAIKFYEKAIELNPFQANTHNNLGVVFQELAEIQKAKDCYEKAIKINPNHTNAYWNSHTLASDIDGAISILKKLYTIDNRYTKAKIMISALEGCKGNFSMFDEILASSNSNHPYTRSIKWVFSLHKLPKIFFTRWDFFDAVIALTESSRPFYEFGVLNAVSFQYLINNFKKGFGFDTFSGLPEAWHNEKEGSYSAFGVVPKIKGGEFIVGKFEDTLPEFFSNEKPLASLINFDADLYSSTLCALNNSHKVIDEKTILIFDEFIMNENWERDEYKALNEFCENQGFNYEVLAISFASKQVAVKLKKN